MLWLTNEGIAYLIINNFVATKTNVDLLLCMLYWENAAVLVFMLFISLNVIYFWKILASLCLFDPETLFLILPTFTQIIQQ